AVAGLAFAGWIEANLRDATVVVGTLAGYAMLMIFANRWGRRERHIDDIRMGDAVWIGMAQALALIPGTSRSGITITVARFLGIARQDAARFSFLLSMPVILMATGYKSVELALGADPVPWTTLGFAALISGMVAYLSIGFFMRVVSYVGLLPFAIYRLALAAVILYVLV
ncbi:MAG: undecaprenyl-diphosphate phosphatase, partial [Woeseiaceae bacterium]